VKILMTDDLPAADEFRKGFDESPREAIEAQLM
jgi:hypothetical protein